MARIGFVTAADLSRFFPSDSDPLLTHDDAVAADFLRQHKHEVIPVRWGTDETSTLDLAVVRSPWDYSDSEQQSTQFFAWLRQLSHHVPVWNPVPLLLWNLDKHYLAALAAADVPTVPTEFFEATDPLDEDLLAARCRRDGALVLKPCISAGARDTFLIREPEDTQHLQGANGRVDGPFATWRGDRSFMLQPFLSEISERGEWSLVFIDGTYTHAVLKLPARGEWLVQDELGGSVRTATPPAPVRAVAEHAHDAIASVCPDCHDTPLYARVDVIETHDGPRVGEVELVEPELFFKPRGTQVTTGEAALAQFQRGIERRLGDV
ncbi:MAG: hypothetical protein AAF581_17990 [Planctomycetota bacterium]